MTQLRRALVALVIGAVMAVGLLAPANAAPNPRGASTSRAAQAAPVESSTPTRAVKGPAQFSEGGCGWFQRCIYFNRSEQAAIAAGSGFIVAAALCAEVGALCVVAGGIVAAAYAYLLFQRGGAICPTYRPRLKAHWFPTQGIDGCVA